MKTKKQKRDSQVYYYLYKGFSLIDLGLVLSVLISIIQGPVLSSVLGYAEKSWQFGVLVTAFVYTVPLLVTTTLARIFHFLWGRKTDFIPQLSQTARIGSSIFVVLLTVLFSIIFKSTFLTPMPYEYLKATLWLIPITAIIGLFTFSYTLIKNHRNQA